MTYVVEAHPYLDSASLFSKVASQPWAMYLDSGVTHLSLNVSEDAEYDILAIKPRVTLVTQDQLTTVSHGDVVEHTCADPLELIRNYLDEPAAITDESVASEYLSSYLPGAIGYFAYDLARRFEKQDEIALNDELLPEMAVGVYDVVVVVDHKRKLTQLVFRVSENGSQAQLDSQALQAQWRTLIEAQLTNQEQDQAIEIVFDEKLKSEPIQDNMNQQQYSQCFNSVRNYTVEGDCYQVNLAKRFSAKVAGNAWLTYYQLRSASPAPYGAYFNFPFAQVLSNSPESFIQCRDRKVKTSPIKGTKPRDHCDPGNDQAIAQLLLASSKDRAENLMIVDLMRNDLSRCCELGSVKVPTLFALHSFANVHHLISTITGVLKKNLHVLDLFRSCFPGGSITGAPKIRAMQIIEELEPHRRGLYCGSIAYIGMDGSLETNIAIRTMVIKDGIARYSAGGGLVIDSDVEEEYQEIIDKARMMNQALSGV
ncbi:MAG: para-aminobenzoate synthetase component 1 [Arenicella sp.]|jgi:para-aminobenzoate synthetase component 1